MSGFLNFVYYYPLFMAFLWMIGSIYYFFHWEDGGRKDYTKPPKLDRYPGVSILVPCHNESENIEESVRYCLNVEYPTFEIILINDGSTDNTGEILDRLACQNKNVRVIHLATNQGKAMAMNMGALASNYEYLICIDGDAILDKHSIVWIIRHFITGPRVGAVTGNPRIRTRSTLLGKIQVGEFSSIIGVIKRAQRVYGRVFTVSGVVAGFSKTALHRVGFWDTDMITEDVDISWKLQLAFWDVRYEPNALCWILNPETLRGLWAQRLRWAQGGSEVLLKNFPRIIDCGVKCRRMWMIIIEFIISVAWSYAVFLVLLFWLIGLVAPLPDFLYIKSILPGWTGVVLGAACLLQFATGFIIDSRFESRLGKYYYWIIWYPMVYWLINVLTLVCGFPKACYRRINKTRAIWKSPDRGVR